MATHLVLPMHGKQHCPGGPDPIPCFKGIPGFHGHQTTTISTTTGNDTTLLWDEWTMDGAAGEFFDEGFMTGGRLETVELVKEGWYSIYCWVNWQAEPASGFAGIMMLDDDVDVFEFPVIQGVTYPVNFHLTNSMTFNVLRYLPGVHVSGPDPQAPATSLQMWVVQNSGVNRTVAESYLTVGYLGERRTED